LIFAAFFRCFHFFTLSAIHCHCFSLFITAAISITPLFRHFHWLSFSLLIIDAMLSPLADIIFATPLSL
jgi:hypothetical protein